jgi:isoquinoline 1-oxidoreductase beta subunit
MEPLVALAHLKGDAYEIWAPTQSPQDAQKEAARILGCPEKNVKVHVTFLGGAFGRKAKADFVSEAAFLAKILGKPVRVQWTREDDFKHDYYHSVSNQLLTAGLDHTGKVIAWRHRTAFPPIGTVFGGPDVPGAGDLQQGVTDFPLDLPNLQAEGCKAPAHVRIGWLRSVYNIFHSFANNSFIDELAHATGKDTRDLMLELIGPPRIVTLKELGVAKLSNYNTPLEKQPIDTARFRDVIEKVTHAADWKNRKHHGKALGLAFHRSFLSYTAAVVSVKKNAQGKLIVDEAWIAVDGGKIENRERVRSQMEGAVIFGISIALHGAITMKDGVTEQSNFDSFKVARVYEAPRKIHVDILSSDHPPGGIGEPGVPPIAPAIANAVFALTGQRNRTLPLL